MKLKIGYMALALFTLVGCSKNNDVDTSKTVIKPQQRETTSFDSWLKSNYLDAYNVDYMYRMYDNDVKRGYQLAPASLEASMRMAKLVKHSWFEVYDEVVGPEFMRQYAPRQIFLVGSQAKGLLGTAEGGLQVVLYEVNHFSLDRLADLNWRYLGTMHHEFAHILHQQKTWPVEFNAISAGDYLPGTHGNYPEMKQYAPKGFVTSYARSQASEDVAEVTAAIICWTDQQWTELFAAAGDEGSKKIREKVTIMKSYMRDSYGIDLDKVRDVARRRLGEVPQIRFIEPEWEGLLTNELRSDRVERAPQAPIQDFSWLFVPNATRAERCQIYKQHCSHH